MQKKGLTTDVRGFAKTPRVKTSLTLRSIHDCEVSQQYAVIGQMDAELTQLQHENAGLRQQLRPTADTSGTQGSPQASRDTGES